MRHICFISSRTEQLDEALKNTVHVNADPVMIADSQALCALTAGYARRNCVVQTGVWRSESPAWRPDDRYVLELTSP